MTPPPIDPDLQRIIAGYGLVFGHHLLEQEAGHGLSFRQFVDVALELVRRQPADAALYLAALVAMDIQRTQAEGGVCPARHAAPSNN